tara:strand:- start:242 stop:871 length:630 start_codon:yes stop_codon:yes gene_type:complete
MDSESRFEIKYNFKNFDEFFLKKKFFRKKNLKKNYDDRIINSIYYDTSNLKSANDNLAGISYRKKFRVRWYNRENFFKFEIKSKQNKLTTKIIIDEGYFAEKNNFLSKQVDQFLKKNYLKKICKISYLRSYYKYKDIRITLDRKIKYDSLIDNKKSKYIFSKDIVLEIKYLPNLTNSNNVNYLVHDLPILVSRNSKYLNSLNDLGILKF